MSVFEISRKYSCRTMSETKSKPSKGSTKKKEGDPDAKVIVFEHIHLLLVALLLFSDPLHTMHYNGLVLLLSNAILSDPLNVSTILCFCLFH